MKTVIGIIIGNLRGRTGAAVLLAVLLLAAPRAVAAGASDYSTANRHRVAFGLGYWDSGYRQTVTRDWWGAKTSDATNAVVSLSYSYWTHEQLAPEVTVRVLVAEATSSSSFYYYDYEEHNVVITSVMFGARMYPLNTDSPLRPYVTAGIGPYIGVDDRKERNPRWTKTTTVLSTFGGYAGIGVDVQMGRHLMLDVHTGYNLMADFEEPLGGDENFSGVEFGAGISLLI